MVLVYSLFILKTSNFNDTIYTKFIFQDQLSFSYYLKPGQETLSYTLYLGDLNGLNKDSYFGLISITDKKMSKEDSIIIIPSLIPEKFLNFPDNLGIEDFYNQISNKRGVVLVDNFCTTDWEKNKEKQIYQISSLSPGMICSSEETTRDLDRIIRELRVKKIFISYDTDSYIKFIDNFIKYLNEKGVEYEFIKGENIEKIFD